MKKNLLFTGFHYIEKIKNRDGDGSIQGSLLNKFFYIFALNVRIMFGKVDPRTVRLPGLVRFGSVFVRQPSFNDD